MSLINETKYILNKLEHNPRKRFGQNFLINEEVLDNIIETSNISKDDIVFEIGPGIGSLTKKILDTGVKLYAAEIDNDLADFLHERFFMYDNFNLINEDILKIDLEKIIKKEEGKRFKFIANLPYYITTPIILKLLLLDIDSITVMVQKEVAERFTTKNLNKERSNITYILEYYADSNINFIVPRTDFMPAPKVDSAVITLNIKKIEKRKEFLKKNIFEVKEILSKLNLNSNFDIDLYELKENCFEMIKLAFLHKRKKFIKSITNNSKYDKKIIEKVFNILSMDTNIRPENLSLEEYVKIAYIYLAFIESKI